MENDLTTQLAILSYSIGEGTCSVDGRLVAAAARRIEELESEIVRLRAALPAWHRRPTGPGLWLTYGNKPRSWSFVALRLDADDLRRGSPFETKAVYGPIPEQEAAEAAGGTDDDS